MPNRAAWFRRLSPVSWKLYSLASELALPGMFRYLDARVRFFDGVVERALRAGVDQHLFLAAGYDTRAVRMATSEAAARLTAEKKRRGNGGGGARASVASGGGDSAKVLGLSRAAVKGAAAAASSASTSTSSSSFAPRFFEVDLPHVSAAKRTLVDSVLPDAERWPRPSFVGADLLDAAGALRALEAAGFDASASRPCLATLEGILMYLPPKSAREILRTVSTLLTPGSLLAFDFVVEECFATGGVGYEQQQRSRSQGGGAGEASTSSSDSSSSSSPSSCVKTCPATDSSTYEVVSVPSAADIAFPTYGLVASSVAHHGEPFRSGFEHDPQRHAALAASLGFKVRELLDAPKVVETFFSGKKCRGPVSDYMAMALWEKL